jgi:hypothetical protein
MFNHHYNNSQVNKDSSRPQSIPEVDGDAFEKAVQYVSLHLYRVAWEHQVRQLLQIGVLWQEHYDSPPGGWRCTVFLL